MRRLADDLRGARVAAGLSQTDVAGAIGVSHAKVGRFERHEVHSPDLGFLGAYSAVVGMDLVLRAYPAGDPIRDRAQLGLLEKFRSQLHPSLRWRTEVPLPIEGDLRAWDAEVGGRGWRVRVEAETRVADVQALERRLGLKLRDDPDGHFILLVADTRTNRTMVPALRNGLRSLDSRRILAALRAGTDPRGSGIVVM